MKIEQGMAKNVGGTFISGQDVFTNKFNLDAPDVQNGYWHNLRKGKRCCEKRNNVQRSLMVSVATSHCRWTDLVFLLGKQGSQSYARTLDQHPLTLVSDQQL